MNMPYIQSAFNGWQTRINLIKIAQSVDNDGLIIQSESPITFMGIIQPLKPTELQVSSSGQRRWSWYQIHTQYQLHLVLQPNDLIRYKNVNYKVMLQNDYSLDGYLEYHLIEDYQNA